MKKVAIIIGSTSDGKQCLPGLHYLFEQQLNGAIEITQVIVASIHRNTSFVQDMLTSWSQGGQDAPDVLIAGAGWAAALPGCADAFLRYVLRNDHISVIGVAFEDPKNHQHTLAAQMSLSELPGGCLICKGDDDEVYTGPDGFLAACALAVESELPAIKMPKDKPTHVYTLEGAIKAFSEAV